MKTLTNEELAETATVLLAQVDRADLRITYAGNGWFHRHMKHSNYHLTPSKERRGDVERTIAGLHERIGREAAERPEKDRKAREAEAHDRLIKAAPDMLAALTKIAWAADAGRQFNPGTEQTMRDLFVELRDEARAAMAKATRV